MNISARVKPKQQQSKAKQAHLFFGSHRPKVHSTSHPEPGAGSLLAVLCAALQGSNKLAALFLLYSGVDPNATDATGASAIAWAAFSGDVDFLFLLTVRVKCAC